jgi:hypothetical protein
MIDENGRIRAAQARERPAPRSTRLDLALSDQNGPLSRSALGRQDPQCPAVWGCVDEAVARYEVRKFADFAPKATGAARGTVAR